MWEKAGWDGFLLCRLNQVDPVIMGALHLTSWVQGYSEGGPSGWVLQSEHGLPELRLPSSPDPPPPIPPLQGPRTHLARSHSCVNASVMSPRPFSVLVGLSCWSMNSLVPVWPRVPISTKCSGIRGSTREAELAGDRNPHRRACTPTKPTRRHTNQQRPETQANRRE